MTNKAYKQKYFSVTIKNLNWEILTKNQLLLKGGMGLWMKTFNNMEVP